MADLSTGTDAQPLETGTDAQLLETGTDAQPLEIPSDKPSAVETPSNDSPLVSTETQEPKYGCQHYKRRCSFVSPCCGKVYICRLCHNAAEKHEIDRHGVMEIICSECQCQQPVTNECIGCGVSFGRYFCQICRMFDDNDKGQYHCDECGICRTGGRENYFHCMKCDICINVQMRDNHKCIDKIARSDCPICLGDMHSSTERLEILNCGHLTHRKCYRDMLKTGKYACPLCCVSTIDLTAYWKQLDIEIAARPRPLKDKDRKVGVMCRDCHKNCETPFHVLGQKCQHCGSYNTRMCDSASSPGQ